MDESLFKPTERASAQRPKRDPLDHDDNGKKGGSTPNTVDTPVVSDDLDDLTITKLKTVADEENIDLGGVTKKTDIVQVIRATREQKSNTGGTEQPAGVFITPEGEPIDADDDDDGIGEMNDRRGNVFE